jgi:hypothetical protein
MKNVILSLITCVVMFACKDKPKDNKEEVNSEEVVEMETKSTENDWEVIFDGTSFENLKGYLADGVSEHWKLEDGAMVFYPPKDRKKGEAHNLVTKKEYTDFILSLDWKIAEAGNSGIFWGVHEDPNLPEAYQTGPEIQVLDNQKHPDGKNGTTHQAGALYDMVAPSADVTKPVGEWNSIEITINHKTNEGSVVLNDIEIVSFPVNDPGWGEMVSTSKFADWEHFGKYKTGKIGFQDHGDKVAFRNIKIKEL